MFSLCSSVSLSGTNCVIRENVGSISDIHEDTRRHTKDNFLVFLCVLCASVVNCLVVAEGYVASLRCKLGSHTIIVATTVPQNWLVGSAHLPKDGD